MKKARKHITITYSNRHILKHTQTQEKNTNHWPFLSDDVKCWIYTQQRTTNQTLWIETARNKNLKRNRTQSVHTPLLFLPLFNFSRIRFAIGYRRSKVSWRGIPKIFSFQVADWCLPRFFVVDSVSGSANS